MDSISDYLTSYAMSLTFEDLPPEVVHQAKRVLVDTLACALGGVSGRPYQIANEVAAGVSSPHPATIWGTGQRTTAELAAFANGVAIRHLDYNDTYTSKELGHPSDNVAGILATAEAVGAPGKSVIVAMVLAYEVFCRFCDAVQLRSRGFDHATIDAVAASLAVAKVMGLPPERMAQALNIAVNANAALFQVRLGDVSMWKSCAAANANRNAIFAALLASKGLSGPSPIFEGCSGFFQAVSGGPFSLDAFGGKGRPFKIMETSMKRYPVGHVSQTAVEAALQLRPQLPRPEEIASVDIKTFQTALDIMADNPEKWHPTNRETADHSMPYSVAVALMYGDVNWRHFGQEYLAEVALQSLVQKVKVAVAEECNRSWPEGMLNILEVTTGSGDKFAAQARYHRGHWRNPMSDQELEEKFRTTAQGLLSSGRTAEVLDCLWNLEQLENVGRLAQLLIVDSPGES